MPPERNPRRVNRRTERFKRAQRQPTITRRQLLGAGLIAGTAVAGGVAAGGLSLLESLANVIAGNGELRQREKKYEKEAQEADAVLQGLDLGIDGLGEFISTQDSFLASRLSEPILIYQSNKKNLLRNKPRLLLEDLRKRGAAALKSPAFESIKDFNYFFIQVTDDPRNLAASYSPSEKTIHLNSKLANLNLLDLLIVYHELVHVVQDTNVRKTLTTAEQVEKYFAFLGDRVRIIGLFEHEAYLDEVQLLNLLTKGQLRTDVLSGRLDINRYFTFLGAREEQRGTVAFLLDIARKVFVPSSPYAQRTDALVNFINDQYSARGAEIYDITQDRKLIRIK